MLSFSSRKAGGWKASYVSLCACFLNDNARLLLPLRKQRISAVLASIRSIQSFLLAFLT